MSIQGNYLLQRPSISDKLFNPKLLFWICNSWVLWYRENYSRNKEKLKLWEITAWGPRRFSTRCENSLTKPNVYCLIYVPFSSYLRRHSRIICLYFMYEVSMHFIPIIEPKLNVDVCHFVLVSMSPINSYAVLQRSFLLSYKMVMVLWSYRGSWELTCSFYKILF